MRNSKLADVAADIFSSRRAIGEERPKIFKWEPMAFGLSPDKVDYVSLLSSSKGVVSARLKDGSDVKFALRLETEGETEESLKHALYAREEYRLARRIHVKVGFLIIMLLSIGIALTGNLAIITVSGSLSIAWVEISILVACILLIVAGSAYTYKILRRLAMP